MGYEKQSNPPLKLAGNPTDGNRQTWKQKEEIHRREQGYTDARYVASYLLRRYCLLTLRVMGKRVGLHYRIEIWGQVC